MADLGAAWCGLATWPGTNYYFRHFQGSLMTMICHVRTLGCLALFLVGSFFSGSSVAQTTAPAALPNETPAKLEPVTDSFDYVKRDVMIPMRDGVKLHTVIVIPKGAKNAPIL